MKLITNEIISYLLYKNQILEGVMFMVKDLNENISKQIDNNLNDYSEKIIELQYSLQPELIIKYNKLQKEKFLGDIKSTLNFLSVSIRVGSKELYLSYIRWLTKLVKKIKIPMEEMLVNFQCIKEVINSEIVLDEGSIINEYVDESIKYLVSMYESQNIDKKNNLICIEMREFIGYLINFQKDKATQLILDKIENNIDLKAIYIEYLQGALYEIGELWMEGKISVAKEHYCTAVIQHIISLMYPYLFQNKLKKGRTMFSVSAGNELHEIGIRMVTDFFELDGWDTFYLGSNIPIHSIIKELKERKTDLLAISITMGNNIQFAVDLINNIKMDEALKDIKIIVGGRVFNEVKGLWKKIKADGYGEDAEESVKVGNKLIEEQNKYMAKEG